MGRLKYKNKIKYTIFLTSNACSHVTRIKKLKFWTGYLQCSAKPCRPANTKTSSRMELFCADWPTNWRPVPLRRSKNEAQTFNWWKMFNGKYLKYLNFVSLFHAPCLFFAYRFQAAIKKYGVPETEIFQTADLFERRNIPQVTLCLYSLARIVSSMKQTNECMVN